VEELTFGATHREAFLTTDSKSGSSFERLVIDGEPRVLKHVHPDHDWTMRFCGDLGCPPVQVWAAGLMDVLPERIDHATIAVAGGLGRDGRGGAILMRDVGADLVPAGDLPLSLAVHARYLDDPGGAQRSDARLARRHRAGPAGRPLGLVRGRTAWPVRPPAVGRTWCRG